MKKALLVGSAAVILLLPLMTMAASTGKIKGLKLAREVSGTDLSTQGFEKIPAPWAVGSFSDIRESGNALWGKRKGAGDKPQVSGKVSSEGLACMSTALDTQNAAAIAAITARDDADHAAMAARSACLKDALAATSEVLSKMQACNKTYSAARKTSATTADAAVKAAQTQFVTDVRACATNNPSTDASALDASKVFMATMVPKPEEQGGQGQSKEQPKTGGDSKTAGTQDKPKPQMSTPPQQAIDACSTLAAQATCTFVRPNNNESVSGTCGTIEGGTQLVCKPAMHAMSAPPTPPTTHTESGDSHTGDKSTTTPPTMPTPPQQAIDACSSLTAETACSFVRPNNNETVNGTCRKIDGYDALVCAPAAMMHQ